MTYGLFTNLLKYTFISFEGTNKIYVCESIKTTKLVQASTTACLSSANVGTARLDTLVSTRSTRGTCRVVSRRDESSGIWAIGKVLS